MRKGEEAVEDVEDAEDTSGGRFGCGLEGIRWVLRRRDEKRGCIVIGVVGNVMVGVVGFIVAVNVARFISMVTTSLFPVMTITGITFSSPAVTPSSPSMSL